MARTVLVRHALAGDKARWAGDDALRPLEPAGAAQALQLVPLLGAVPVRRVLTSPLVRCRRTVEPLAAARGLAVEEHAALRPDARVGDVLALLRSPGAAGALVCTHGEVLVALGLAWSHGEPEKGGAWLVEHPLQAGATPVRVLPAPAAPLVPGPRAEQRQAVAG
ncbi:SixA phosphatase family protein [Vallicoccus soli]|uniref:SixA phosphatase family protein n=1 Tax=Vallicoccus soli TaxID=2339232 RepID=UPI0014023A7D|nr:phosphoglycerate mutase family protein [Vallicoccus soli]